MPQHPLIAECNSLGITLKVTSEGLEIGATSKLNDELRAKLVDAKPDLMAELTGTAQIIPIRWAEFVRECEALGATAEQVQAMFNETDIQDLCEEPNNKIHLHAKTIVDAIKRECT